MYCCGLRPFEVRLLEDDDINLDTGRSFIKQSMGHKDRIVMIPQDLLETGRTYRMRVKYLFPDSKSFFPNHKGDVYFANLLRYLFELCWPKAGIEAYGLPKPMVYDFRHTYRTYRLYRWMEEDRDITAWLPLFKCVSQSRRLLQHRFLHPFSTRCISANVWNRSE
jgi:integrase/recombinase XerD